MNSKERLIFDCIDAHTQGNPVRLVKGPKPEEMNNKVYKFDDKCYVYKAQNTSCKKK